MIMGSAIALPSFSNPAAPIVGFEKARHFQKQGKGSWYIQAGAFTRHANATQYQQSLKKKIPVPVRVEKSGEYYRVILGPLHSAGQVRQIAALALNPKAAPPAPPKYRTVKPTRIAPAKLKPYHKDKDLLPVKTGIKQGILLSVDGGFYQSKNRQMTVDNGSGFPSPSDRDSYTGKKSNPGSAGLTLGWYRDRETRWLPAWSLGLRYKYMFSDTRGQVIQYSLPEYRNYDYQWKMTSNILLAQGKLAITRFSRFLPYVSAGAGVALNRSASYSESALPGITARISPDFGKHSQTQATYVLGTGLDYQISPNLLFSVGYEFQDFGRFQTGPGTATWASEALTQSSIHANALLFSVNYWLEQ